MQLIRRMWDEKPLALLLYGALFIRLLSVIFSRGYGMHDDHFLVIEASKSWADGFDYNYWLPTDGATAPTPSGHSFFYSGLHYFLFCFLKMIGIADPQGQMLVVRLLHALLSLVIIYCGFRITEKVAGLKQAKMVGLLLAVFWMMPFLSVRNLVEFVCISPLMLATWIVIKNGDSKKLMPYVLAGILLGIAFSIRFQIIMFTGGFGLALLFMKRIKETIVLGFSVLIIAASTQGLTDYFIWGRPFVEFEEYIRYNIEYAHAYIIQQWYMYLFLIVGILLPPISFFLFFGFLRSWKKHLLLFLPAFIFLVFHSYFPNKQERFILPVIPFIIMLGYIGWDQFVQGSSYWKKHPKFLKGCWTWFWCLNILALSVISFAYSKKNRVESMTYIADKGDVTFIAIEDSNRDEFLMPPLFYLQKWGYVYGITKLKPASDFYNEYMAAAPQD
ncbi:MAG: glycosyltransferase family 39 protein, partial [Bacteroidota bacterium]|nr:glycosyltransferase family 39 protein [Bacteroidota bacterium]